MVVSVSLVYSWADWELWLTAVVLHHTRMSYSITLPQENTKVWNLKCFLLNVYCFCTMVSEVTSGNTASRGCLYLVRLGHHGCSSRLLSSPQRGLRPASRCLPTLQSAVRSSASWICLSWAFHVNAIAWSLYVSLLSRSVSADFIRVLARILCHLFLRPNHITLFG